MTNEYSDKLKDPRWQKRRLDILNRDEWVCQRCYSENKTLTVHHLCYMPHLEPWEYPNKLLITLCVDCNKYERDNIDDALALLCGHFRNTFLSDEIITIATGLAFFEPLQMKEILANAYKEAFKNVNIQRYLIARHFYSEGCDALAKPYERNLR